MDPGINNSENSWSRGFTPWEDPASADWPGEDLPKSNVESLYNGGDEFWGAVALPDWSDQYSAQRARKSKNWCNGCQCEHPWPKNGYTFHVRSRRANDYLRSLQLAGEVLNINPMSVEPLAEVTEYIVSKDAHNTGRELLKRLRGDGSKDNSAGGCCFELLVGFYLNHPGYASFQTPSNAEEFLSSAEGAEPVTKWNEFFELIHKQHQEAFPTYYTPHTGGIPHYFYQRFPLLAEQAQWTYGYGESDSQITSHGQARPSRAT